MINHEVAKINNCTLDVSVIVLGIIEFSKNNEKKDPLTIDKDLTEIFENWINGKLEYVKLKTPYPTDWYNMKVENLKNWQNENFEKNPNKKGGLISIQGIKINEISTGLSDNHKKIVNKIIQDKNKTITTTEAPVQAPDISSIPEESEESE
jgi:hypothetical protein